MSAKTVGSQVLSTADELDRFRGQGGVERWRWDKPVLVIVDYAASRAEQIRAIGLRELVDASLDSRAQIATAAAGTPGQPRDRLARDRSSALATTIIRAPQSRCSIRRSPSNFPALDELEFRRRGLRGVAQEVEPRARRAGARRRCGVRPAARGRQMGRRPALSDDGRACRRERGRASGA